MANTRATITYLPVKGMCFYNAESCKELIITVIRAGPTIFQSSLCGEFSISFYLGSCHRSHGSGWTTETSKRPSPNLGLCVWIMSEMKKHYLQKAAYHYCGCYYFLLFVQVWLLRGMNRFCAHGSNYNLILFNQLCKK